MLAYARRILALGRSTRRAVQPEKRRRLRLGVPEDFAAERLMPILSRFGREHAGVRLEVTGLGPELMRLYREGEFDPAFGP